MLIEALSDWVCMSQNFKSAFKQESSRSSKTRGNYRRSIANVKHWTPLKRATSDPRNHHQEEADKACLRTSSKHHEYLNKIDDNHSADTTKFAKINKRTPLKDTSMGYCYGNIKDTKSGQETSSIYPNTDAGPYHPRKRRLCAILNSITIPNAYSLQSASEFLDIRQRTTTPRGANRSLDVESLLHQNVPVGRTINTSSTGLCITKRLHPAA
ncbi:hypothetical protein GWK47_018923 [Chionoecetes opilio]|uniref:Uncharacterized protein n=1 Tax=Chionoecetes opilio TaxID=41210 RepID=A0A8J4XQT3_CHIOP|nr:hypothetical protein GWK47_018923 [Chionoecetes opilio]